MLNQETINLMQSLTDINGVASNERLVAARLKQDYEQLADEVIYDNLGSIYAVKKSQIPNAPHVMVSGHMDEVGLIVTKVLDNGLLQALLLGDMSTNSLLGASVQGNFAGKNYQGTILAQTENNQVVDKTNKVQVDLGFLSKAAVEKAGVQLGDTLSFATSFVQTESGVLMSRNWNGRYAPILGIELLQALQNVELPFDLYVGCTVQEQVGLRGIQTATNKVAPDLAIMLDTDAAFDYQTDSDDRIGVLGDGVLLNYYDKTVLPNRLLLQTFRETCEQDQIPYQYYYSLADSEAGWVNKLRTGCPTLFVNIPVRNMNTPRSVIAAADYQAAKAGLIQFIKQIDNDSLQAFKAENR